MSNRHILLAVTGMSPQVVTETLYVIQAEQRRWPDEIRVITTRLGAERVAHSLIEQGFLARLCRDYGLDEPAFSRDHIMVVPDAEGMPVDDARTVSDHEALADFITRTVCELTREPESGDPADSLHASLAGGRKTMTFYLGYAMSLFARPEDCLSHVLVSEAFENQPDFFYPTPESRLFTTGNGQELDACRAEVVLADIPFIRHRDYLPGRFHHLRDGVRFRSLIDLINLGQMPRQVRVELDDASQSLVIGSVDNPGIIEVGLRPANYLAYRMVHRQNQIGDELIRLPAADVPDTDLAWMFLEEASAVFGAPFDSDATLTQMLDRIEAFNEVNPGGVSNRTVDSLRSGMRRTFLSDRFTAIGATLKDYLPEKLQQLLEIRQLLENGRKLTQAELDHKGTQGRKGAAYCTMLDCEQFQIQPAETDNSGDML